MTVSNDVAEVDDRAYRWIIRGLYAILIPATLWVAFDRWSDTPSGQAFLERCRERIEAAKAKAAECEGCARRRAMMGRAFESAKNRMHWQAKRIVEGDDVPTQPEAPA